MLDGTARGTVFNAGHDYMQRGAVPRLSPGDARLELLLMEASQSVMVMHDLRRQRYGGKTPELCLLP